MMPLKEFLEEINNTEVDDLAEQIFSKENISNGKEKEKFSCQSRWHTSNTPHKYKGIHKSILKLAYVTRIHNGGV